MVKQPKILFFIKGYKATIEQKNQAAQIKGLVCFRNVLDLEPKSPVEKCDGVASCGIVPDEYAHLPDESGAARNVVDELNAAVATVGETLSPESQAQADILILAATTPKATAQAAKGWGANKTSS